MTETINRGLGFDNKFAGEDIDEFLIVKEGSGGDIGTVMKATAASDAILGAIQNKGGVLEGDLVDLPVTGQVMKVVVGTGETINPNDPITADSDSAGAVASAGDHIIGYSAEDVARTQGQICKYRQIQGTF